MLSSYKACCLDKSSGVVCLLVMTMHVAGKVYELRPGNRATSLSLSLHLPLSSLPSSQAHSHWAFLLSSPAKFLSCQTFCLYTAGALSFLLSVHFSFFSFSSFTCTEIYWKKIYIYIFLFFSIAILCSYCQVFVIKISVNACVILPLVWHFAPELLVALTGADCLSEQMSMQSVLPGN